MTRPPVSDWWHGDPDALEVGKAALRKVGSIKGGRTGIRQAVEHRQKVWGVTPTGTLSAEQWDRLLDEAETDQGEADQPDDDGEEVDEDGGTPDEG